MLKNLFTQSVYLFLSLSVLLITQTHPQTKTCDLQLEVIQNPESKEAEEILIKDAVAIFVSKETNKIVKSTLQERMPYFAKLPEEQYRLSVTKEGYKTTSKMVDLDCSLVNNRGVVSEIIFLWKGDTRQIVVMSKLKPSNSVKDDSQLIQSNSIGGLDPVQSGVVNEKAIKLVKPSYPPAARIGAPALGTVNVQVLIDENGNVISAKAVSGDSLLHKAAEKAALKSKFNPTLLEGQPVKVNGIIVYIFVP